MKYVHDILDELDKAWPGNEFRLLDEQGNEYRATLVEEEDKITYMKMEKLDVSSL